VKKPAPIDERTVRALVRDELRRMLAREERVYSTRAGDAPPGYGREAWRAIAHAIGTKRGRYWYVTAEQLETYERQRDAKPANDSPKPSTWHPRMAGEALGLRKVGGQ
jgi:hypothetical protein